MISTILNIFNNKKSKAFSKDNCIIEHKETTHLFSLKYQNSVIGTLKFENDEWLFEYSVWFKNQNELQPLLEFPIVGNKYKTKDLWPFFSNRIPSFKQPKIKNYIEKHPSERTNTAKLLELFGEHSVNNPFKLETK
jgi:HipA-like protein